MRTILLLSLLLLTGYARAQDNYEIQVYGAQTMEQGSTMLELHSNFTFGGREYEQDGVLPTHNMLHETVEITHGFTNWFETGFYLFNAFGSADRSSFVGSHVRPRVMVPAAWHWPVGLSLSAEVGYQKTAYSTDDWSLEIRPIIDKTWRKWYIALNPTFDRSLHGPGTNSGYDFAPNAKLSFAVTPKAAIGLEYYGVTGKLDRPDPYQAQQQLLFLAIDLDLSPNWEFNAGYGLGFTPATDNDILKVILGYRFHRRDKNKQPGQLPGCLDHLLQRLR